MILGIDPSLTATGCVWLNKDNSFKKTIIKGGPATHNPVDELKRLFGIRSKINCGKVKLAVMEGLAFSPRNTRALVQLSALNYFIRARLSAHKIRFVIVPPTTLKKFVTGKGNSPKELMLLETYKRYHVDLENNNLCDAYGLAKIGQALTDKTIKLTKFQEEVVELLNPQLTN